MALMIRETARDGGETGYGYENANSPNKQTQNSLLPSKNMAGTLTGSLPLM